VSPRDQMVGVTTKRVFSPHPSRRHGLLGIGVWDSPLQYSVIDLKIDPPCEGAGERARDGPPRLPR
jgi:hypothetical protein